MSMEKNLVIPVQPPCQEEDDAFLAEEAQPYLEAKLYIEKIEQENQRCPEITCDPITCDPQPAESQEPVDNVVSLTVYPIRVPSMHLACATVQWDVPQSDDEALSTDAGSVQELNSNATVSLDWTEELPGQTDTELQPESNVTRENKDGSCQDMDESTCETPSNVVALDPCKETSEVSGDSGLKENTDEGEDSDFIECSHIQVDPESSEGQEKSKDIVQEILTDPAQTLEDAGGDKENVGLFLENGSEGASQIVMCQTVLTHCDLPHSTNQSRKSDQTPEQNDSKPSEESDTLQKSDQMPPSSHADPPEQAMQSSEVDCDVGPMVDVDNFNRVETVPEPLQSEQSESFVNSENSDLTIYVAKLDMISNDETLQPESLQHEDTSAKMQESVWTVDHEEPTCEQQIDNSEETELSENGEQIECLTRMELSQQTSLLECAHEQDSEHLKREIPVDEKPSEESDQSEIATEIEQSQESECSGDTEPSHLPEPESSGQSSQVDKIPQTEQQNEDKDQTEKAEQTEQSSEKRIVREEEQPNGQVHMLESIELPCKNGSLKVADREKARGLAERLYRLENIQRTDVVRHMDKDNEFSHAVREEYLKFFDFKNQSLDEALRFFLKEVVLIGESQERERVLECFSGRYQQCNPQTFSSAGAVFTLTCAVMLLNTDLHGQNVGKAMTFTDFASNMDGMNEGESFSKDILKTLYNSIKNHRLEWAVEEKELAKSMVLEQDSDQDTSLRSKSNPFQDIAHDKKATVFQKGFLKRKAHADIDGKRTPWGKRSWKTFYAVLKGMVLYLQKDEYKKDWQSSEEVLSIHHALAERAEDYTKRPYVFRLQTADWRVFLFEAASTEQMNSWIGRINLVSALFSSPPFPAAVGSQRKFCRPILPATQSSLTLEKQLQSHAAMLQSFQEDLSALQEAAEGRKVKARELEELRQKEEYLQHERSRYEVYVQILEVWQTLGKASNSAGGTDLSLFDQEMWKGMTAEDEENSEVDGGMKRSHSSPSLELELAPPPVVKVRRNISERRTYRKIVIPRRNREL